MTTLNTSAARAGLTAAVLLASATASTAQKDGGGGILVLGLGASREPVFAGSDSTQVEPDPIIEARSGRFFIG